MAFSYYIVPVDGTASVRYPKYFDGAGIIITRTPYSLMDYGNEPWMFVGSDLSAADNALIIAQPDAFGIPQDLTTPITPAQVTAVQNKLEAINLPAGWVNTSLSWTEILRAVLGIFGFQQKYAVIYGQVTGGQSAPTLFVAGVILSSTFSSLPPNVRQAMLATADELKIDRTGLTGGATLRQILKVLGDQLRNRPFNFNGHII